MNVQYKYVKLIMLYISSFTETLTWYLSVFSVILPSPDFETLCPYKNCCSAEAFSQILYCAYEKTLIFYVFFSSKIRFYVNICPLLIVSIGCHKEGSSALYVLDTLYSPIREQRHYITGLYCPQWHWHSISLRHF